MIPARAWLKGLVSDILKPRPRSRLWKWIDRHVSIPVESGSPNPGPIRTGRFQPFRGVCDAVHRPGVHFIALCSSARVFKTLFSICATLWWIDEGFGRVIWLDPTRKSALKFVRNELDPFIMECEPVRRLAIFGRETWTTLEKQFRGKELRIVGSGAEADLHGFHATMAIINEADRCRKSIDRDASSKDKIIARTRQFLHTRLIISNSTPTEEYGDIWRDFLLGTQEYCYLPCPHCGIKQRLTFFPETKQVPFDLDGKPLPSGQTREEKTGFIRFDQFAITQKRPVPYGKPGETELVRVGYNIPAVRAGATYKCAHCPADIEHDQLGWMLERFEWRAHNPGADPERVSFHIWAAYSPWESFGVIAQEFLDSKGNTGAMMKFHTLTLGLPFVRNIRALKEEDLDRAVGRCPVRYVQGQIPLEAEFLTMTVDVQGGQFWWGIRAWGILWDHPDWPTWSALIDWGEAVSWEQIEEFAGLRPLQDGNLRDFVFKRADGTERRYLVTAGLVDSGFNAEENKNVYEFCLRHQSTFSAYKGGDQSKTRGAAIRIAPVMDNKLDLVWAWSDFFAAQLYYSAIRDGKNSLGETIHWWLPVNIDDHYRKQLTNEKQEEEKGKMVWKGKENHLGDMEKMQEVLRDTIEEQFEAIRAARRAEIEEQS